MDTIINDDPGEDSDSDDETAAGADLNGLDLDDWKEHMAAWVFYAAPGEGAPEQLVRVFCGDGEGSKDTATALGQVVDEIRSALWTERQGEAEDVEKIRKVEEAGDYPMAYNMRLAQGLYAQSKFKQMRSHLFEKLDTGLHDLKLARQAKVDDGTFVAAKVHYKAKSAKSRKREGQGKGSTSKGSKGSGTGKGHQETKSVGVLKGCTKEAAPSVAAAKAKLALDAAKDIKDAVGGSAAEVMAESSQTASAK